MTTSTDFYHASLHCSDPETTEEEELVENLFDVLASCLLLEDNKAVFVEAEGARWGHSLQRGHLVYRQRAVFAHNCMLSSHQAGNTAPAGGGAAGGTPSAAHHRAHRLERRRPRCRPHAPPAQAWSCCC